MHVSQAALAAYAYVGSGRRVCAKHAIEKLTGAPLSIDVGLPAAEVAALAGGDRGAVTASGRPRSLDQPMADASASAM